MQRLPRRFSSGDDLMGAVRPVNAGIADLRLQEQEQYMFAFTWRMTYRADDKRQEIYTVCLSEQGVRLPQHHENNPPASAVDLAALLADAEPLPLETDAEGHTLPPKLPPLTHLVRLAETARKYAIYHADLRCVSHEADILPRLHKTLNRLTTYYQQQIEEVYDTHDPDGEKRHALEEDLNRKIAEEVENHRLRVLVELVSYVAVEVPTAVLEMTLTDGKQQTPVRVVQNRYSGVLRRPVCHACGAETAAIALDRRGHITCDQCIRQCSACQEIICAACGVEPCPVCGKVNCEACGQTCWVCGARACAEHISRCPLCGDQVCHACQTACAHCGVRQCRSHLHADCVAGPGDAVSLICPACAVRCPGCRQYTAQTGLCSASGQRFCQNCLVTCTSCGRVVGPGYYERGPVDRRPYCQSCLRECPACQAATPVLMTCSVCGAQGCPACLEKCAVCAAYLCGQHRQRVKACGHVVCPQHGSMTCAIGKEPVCPVCSAPCAICERPFCDEHTAVCAQCGQEYCRECVRASGLCDTCATVSKQGEPVDLRRLPWADRPEVAKLAPYYRWVKASNTRYTVYFGEGALMSAAVIVVRHTDADGPVLLTWRINAVERLRGMLGL